MQSRESLAREVAGRGKYAPLFRHLCALEVHRWRATFADVEALLGFALPNSARVHRPWWANETNGGHSHALAWQAAGWRTSAVDMLAESLVFERLDAAPAVARGARVLAIDEIFPPHDFGPWPEGLSMRREQLYGDEGR